MLALLSDMVAGAIIQAMVAPAPHVSDVTGGTIDMIQGDGECFAVQMVGDFTADAIEGSIEESSDYSVWTAVAGTAFGEVTAGMDTRTIRFTRTKRYVRYVATISGVSPSIDLAVLVGERKKYV